jgi:hypothetical protein
MDFESLPIVIAIVGSRDFPNLAWIDRFVEKLPGTKIIVSGGARGVDRRAERAANREGHYYKGFHVEGFEWKLLGKGVGHFRNSQLVDYVNKYRGVVIIFAVEEDGKLSPGSKNVKEYCEKIGVPYTIYTVRK